MTQMQFEIIVKIIESGAPALSNELTTALDRLVKERNGLCNYIKHHELGQAERTDAEQFDEKPKNIQLNK